MKRITEFFINGEWVTVQGQTFTEVVNPATMEVCCEIANANQADVDAAFAAARGAFADWSTRSGDERKAFLLKAVDLMEERIDDFIDAHVETLGVPRHQAQEMQVDAPIEGLRYYANMAPSIDQPIEQDQMLITREAVGVCALINPWNYPLLQMIGKVAPALAAGCTVVEKPSEETPTVDFIMAEIFAEAGLPAGVFNLISGVGAEIGPMMSSHPEADMVSFTGSTQSGISVAAQAADSVKRVCQELGGKSPLIILEGADLEAAVAYGVENVFLNAGQTCDALTRMLVPESRYEECVEIALSVAARHIAGDPENSKTTVGPLVAWRQKERVEAYIAAGIEEGAEVLWGGLGLPEGVTGGAYIKPTIFGRVLPSMRIAKEEIFGPVVAIMTYETLDEAIWMANDTEFGLSSAVWGESREAAVAVAKQLRAGQCFIQGGFFRVDAPFGGVKQSGNGREWGELGLAEYLETKAIIG